MKLHIFWKWQQFGGDFSPIFHIEKYPFLYKGAALYVVLIELTFIFMVVKQKLRYWAFLLALLFHIGAFITLHIAFMQLIIVYITVFNFDYIFARKPLQSANDSISFKKPLAIAGMLLISFNIIFGIGKIHSWPFTVYPTFDFIPPKTLTELKFIAIDGNEHSRVLDVQIIKKEYSSWHYQNWAQQALDRLNEGDTLQFKQKAASLIQLFPEQQLEGIETVELWIVTKSIDPYDPSIEEQLIKKLIRRQMLR